MRRPDEDPGISRRRLLQAGSAALAEIACGTGTVSLSGKPENAATARVPFAEPASLRSLHGVLEVTLRVSKTAQVVDTVSGGRRVTALTYNGSLPGPTLRVQPGHRLDLLLENQLDSVEPFCGGAWQDDQNRPHGFDTTNLHTHGLHVSPASLYPDGKLEPSSPGELPELASDDVLLAIPPGESQRYRIWLPEFHAPGTHWYHAHKHGSAAFQVASGLVGALIVEEPPEHRLVAAEADRLWIVHEAAGATGAELYTRNPPLPRFLINGRERPTLEVRPGELQRWRFVNAAGSLGASCRLRLLDSDGQPHPLHLMAVDGISFYGKTPQARTSWLLPPGGRADFLVLLERPGRYRVVKDEVAGAPKTFRQDLGFVEVAGPHAHESLPPIIPGERPSYLAPIETASSKPGKVRFGIRGKAGEAGPCGLLPNRFVINDRTYDHDCIDHDLALGAVEEWEITNASAMLHAFHIHVNPFQVVDGTDHLMDPEGLDEPANRIWRDTLNIPPRNSKGAGSVKIRTRFINYPGRFVLHCHILVHEDLGMMQNVRVTGPGAPPCAPLARPARSGAS